MLVEKLSKTVCQNELAMTMPNDKGASRNIFITFLSGYKDETLLFAASTWRNQERHKGCLQIHYLQHKWTSR